MDAKTRADQYDFVGTWEHTPSGTVLVQKDLFCIRCAAIQRFSVSTKEISSRLEHQTDTVLLEIKVLNAGWVLTSARVDGKPYDYVLCPACITEDFKRFYNYKHLIHLKKE